MNLSDLAGAVDLDYAPKVVARDGFIAFHDPAKESGIGLFKTVAGGRLISLPGSEALLAKRFRNHQQERKIRLSMTYSQLDDWLDGGEAHLPAVTLVSDRRVVKAIAQNNL